MKLTAVIIFFLSSTVFARGLVEDRMAVTKIFSRPEVVKELAGKNITQIEVQRADGTGNFSSHYTLRIQSHGDSNGPDEAAETQSCLTVVTFDVFSGFVSPVYMSVQASTSCAN